jgi:hypothetical protein
MPSTADASLPIDQRIENGAPPLRARPGPAGARVASILDRSIEGRSSQRFGTG